jgi:transposase InsO family protein
MRLHKEGEKAGPLCGVFGVSRQAYYQHSQPDFSRLALRGFIIEYVNQIRLESPRIGCQKLYVMCKEYFKELFTIGRDAFYQILRQSGLMLKLKRRHRCRTTQSGHDKPVYPNLIRDFHPMAINQLWVCDITYVWTLEGFCFLSLVTDAYSHMIIGYTLAPRLDFHYTEEALDMALASTSGELKGLIHHSDRGIQYAYPSYTDKLRKHHITISMTENGDPLENAMAERVNGILKQEWLSLYEFKDIHHVRRILEPAIEFYNTRRPHASINLLTPVQAKEKTGTIKNQWKRRKPVHSPTSEIAEEGGGSRTPTVKVGEQVSLSPG